MGDIVQRLREPMDWLDDEGFVRVTSQLLGSAADEIARLRTRIAEMSALARSVRERVDALIQMEIDEAGREALAAHL